MVNNDQKVIQSAQLKILKEIDRVCKQNNIAYWLAFGTAIGAVRHQGFIPWDDDIDIFMLAKDLEKLEKYQDCFSKNVFIQSRRTDPEYGLMITRVRDSNTTLIENSEKDRDINHGIFVDIYPLYNVPLNKIAQMAFFANSLLARLLLYGKVPKHHGLLMKIGSRIILACTSEKFRKNQVERIYRDMINQPETGYLSYAYGSKTNRVFPKEYFLPSITVQFEDINVPIQKNYDEILTEIYGDYMKLPPLDKQVVHHDYVKIDAERPYTDYRGIYYCQGVKQ